MMLLSQPSRFGMYCSMLGSYLDFSNVLCRRVVWPWLGLKMLDLKPMVIAQLKERLSSFPDVSKGVFVSVVAPGCPAERAGFAPGDVVIEFDGKQVESVKEIIDIVWGKVGRPFEVLVQRANDVSVILTVIPEEADGQQLSA
uniref:Uncharacterized protein n=1 Tax=Avena sativa TaxID=4498 RepID=A0ACD5WAU7_AVESA